MVVKQRATVGRISRSRSRAFECAAPLLRLLLSLALARSLAHSLEVFRETRRPRSSIPLLRAYVCAL